MNNDTTNTVGPQQARIGRSTKRIELPVPTAASVEFAVQGTWSSTGDPTGTSLRVIFTSPAVRRGGSPRKSEHLMTRDTSFVVPFGATRCVVLVDYADPAAELRVTLKPTAAEPKRRQQEAQPSGHKEPVGVWGYRSLLLADDDTFLFPRRPGARLLSYKPATTRAAR
jgi:hypothetical protein